MFYKTTCTFKFKRTAQTLRSFKYVRTDYTSSTILTA